MKIYAYSNLGENHETYKAPINFDLYFTTIIFFVGNTLAVPKLRVFLQVTGDTKYKENFISSIEAELKSLGNVDLVENGYDYAVLLTLKGYVFEGSKKRSGWAIGYVFCVLKKSTKCNLLYIDRVYSDVLFADVGELGKAAKEIVNKLDTDILKKIER